MTDSTLSPPAHSRGLARPLGEQLAETCILQCYVIETLDAQHSEPTLRHRSEVHAVLDRMLEVLHQHTTELASRLEPLAEGQGQLRADTWLAGRGSNVAGRTPRFEIRAMLLDDCALLNLAAMHYKILLNAAVAEQDPVTAQLAGEHLEELEALTEDVLRILPPSDPVPRDPAPAPRPQRYPVSVWQTSTTAA